MTDSIVISWTPPINQDIMIRSYIIGWGIGVPDSDTVKVAADQRFYEIKNLSKYDTYNGSYQLTKQGLELTELSSLFWGSYIIKFQFLECRSFIFLYM